MIEANPRITDHTKRLLHCLVQRSNEWLTRSDIAQAMGKNRLTPYDIKMLETLRGNGLIQCEKEAGYTREGFRWLYRWFDR